MTPMKQYPFMQVDAFTAQPLGGNPCAVFFDCADLDKDLMLNIAREMNLSESSFVMPSKLADFRVRYFTPMGEIPLAGHPTIATVYALIDSGRLVISAEVTNIILEMQAGIIPVQIFAPQKIVQRITMSQKTPTFLRIYGPEQILPVFGLEKVDLADNSPIQTVSTGTPQLMIHVRDLAVLKKINTNSANYRALHQEGDWFSCHFFCLKGISPNGRTFARHLSPPPDIFEDPFTGSATGGMAAYLWHYNFLKEPTFIAEQGHWMNRPGMAHVCIVGSRDSIETVQVGGAAVTVMTGKLSLAA